MASIVSAGTKYAFDTQGAAGGISATLLTDNKFVACYKGVFDRGYAIVGTIAEDGTINYGNRNTFDTGTALYCRTFKLTDDKFILFYFDNSGNPDYAYSVIGTVTGTTISWGNFQMWHQFSLSSLAILQITNNQFVIHHNHNVQLCTVNIETGAMSYGPESEYSNYNVTTLAKLARLNDTRFMLTYQSETGQPEVIIGEVSGNNIVFELPLKVFNTRYTDTNRTFSSLAPLSETKVLCFLGSTSGQAMDLTVATVDGYDVSWGPLTRILDTPAPGDAPEKLTVLSDKQIMVSYTSGGSSDYFAKIADIAGDAVTGLGAQGSFSPGNTTISNQYLPIDADTLLLVFSDWDANNSYGSALLGTLEGVIIGNPRELSLYYGISSVKGNIRGKAKAGFIRPTVKQFFTSINFNEITNTWPTDLLDSPYLDDPAEDGFIKANTVSHTYTGSNGDLNLYRTAWEDFGRYFEVSSKVADGTDWLQVDFGEGKKIRKIGLAGWDATSYPHYLLPKAFLITGSNDESNWTTLLNGTTLTTRPPMMTWQYMNLDTTGTYRYYRLVLMEAHYSDGMWISMGNWKLFER